MSAIFVDTVGLLALWDRADQWHPAAATAFERLKEANRELITTAYVILECGNAAARRPYRGEVDVLREQFESAKALVHPSETDWRQAWEGYRRGAADQAGIVDQVSFVVMRRLGLTHAFTNDRHYLSAGFATLF